MMNDDYLCITCPHCNNCILIYKKDINCGIFRHGIIKTTGQQIDPHASKDVCDYLIKNEKIYGCGKPFKLSSKDTIAVICEYI